MPRKQVTECLPDKVQLVDVGPAWPQWLTGEEFGVDAANGPRVDGWPILRVADEQLRRAVPPGCYIVCVLVADTRYVERQTTKML